jgi:glycosyltransferase involved in cell wall biosynthesis
VIIPTYNRSGMVTEAVDSVLEQDFQDMEIIVVDDGSTDGTEKALRGLLPRIRYLRQENSGVSSARNRGVAEARGSWIAFLDSDDLWLPDKLKTQALFFKTFPGSRICHTNEIWIRRGRRVNPRLRHRRSGGWLFEDLCELSLISPSSILIRRDLLDEAGGFDEGLPAGEDYDLWLKISLISRIDYISRPLVIKRGGHDDQLSRTVWGLDRFRISSLRRMLEEHDLSPRQRRAAIRSLRTKCLVLAEGGAKRGRREMAAYYRRLMNEYPEDSHGTQGNPPGQN